MLLRIAHFSDVHLAPVHGLALRHANVKRALGLANWLRKRRKVHLRRVVDALVADLRQQAVDHIIVSGDLTNLGLPGEHAAALTWLEALGPPTQVSVVPGNHDIYCRLRSDPGVERWRAYMMSDEQGRQAAVDGGAGFPYVRRLGRLAIVGLNSAIPTVPFYAIGRIGQRQLDALDATLQRLGRDRLMRLVVIHHPPLPGQADARRGLVDAVDLEQVLLRHNPELVIHGHNHRDMHAVRDRRGGRTDVVGVASASVGRIHKEEPLGRYNLIRLDPERPEAGIEINSRGLAAPNGAVVDLGSRQLGQRQQKSAGGSTARPA